MSQENSTSSQLLGRQSQEDLRPTWAKIGTPISKPGKTKGLGSMAKVIELLHSQGKALGLIPSSKKKRSGGSSI
jgi:hypothetical protein